jgi:hypothetical protein
MSSRRTFQSRCAAADDAAWKAAHPFVPSPAQYEEALAPLVAELCLMGQPDAREYVRKTFTLRGLMPLAVDMYKRRLALRKETA